MSMMTIGGSLVSGLYSLATPAPSVPQDRVLGVFENSLWDHADDYREVPEWLHRMTVANGGQSISGQGQFGFTQGWSKNPPDFDQDWLPEVATPDASASWASIDAAGFTDILLVTDNFSGPPALQNTGTNPRVGGDVPEGGADDYVTEFEDCIAPFEANIDDSPRYWVYEPWADGDQLIDHPTGYASASDFAAWRERTTGGFGYGTWFDNLVAALKEDLPAVADRIGLIPTARVMVSVMENTPASTLDAVDWFEDSSPHGRDSCYVIAAAITYATLFQETPPQPDFTGASVHSSITSNWATIASHIASEVGL